MKGAKGENIFELDEKEEVRQKEIASNIAKKMKLNGENSEKIAIYTGLSMDEIDKL